MVHDIVDIFLARHPQKKGDEITPHGALQAFAAGVALRGRGVKVAQAFYSGALRTFQAANVMIAGLGPEIYRGTRPLERPGLNFRDVYTPIFGSGEAATQACLAEIAAVHAVEDSVAQAIRISRYARGGREAMVKFLLEQAREMQIIGYEASAVLCLSHSPWLELAAVEPEKMPYSLPEASIVHYRLQVLRNIIVSSELILPPIPGERN